MLGNKFVINALVFAGTASATRNTYTGGIQDMLPHMFASLDSQSLTTWNFATNQSPSFWFYDTDCKLNNGAESCSAHADLVYNKADFTLGATEELNMDTYTFQATQIPSTTVNVY